MHATESADLVEKREPRAARLAPGCVPARERGESRGTGARGRTETTSNYRVHEQPQERKTPVSVFGMKQRELFVNFAFLGAVRCEAYAGP
jgi:hypothetical protein